MATDPDATDLALIRLIRRTGTPASNPRAEKNQQRARLEEKLVRMEDKQSRMEETQTRMMKMLDEQTSVLQRISKHLGNRRLKKKRLKKKRLDNKRLDYKRLTYKTLNNKRPNNKRLNTERGSVHRAGQTVGQEQPTPSFTLFGKLPIEIRHRIWKLALPGPRLFELKEATLAHTVELFNNYQPPLIRAVCRESWQITENAGSFTLGVSAEELGGIFPGCWFNPERDIVLDWDPLNTFEWLEDTQVLSRIQNYGIPIENTASDTIGETLYGISEYVPNCRKIIIFNHKVAEADKQGEKGLIPHAYGLRDSDYLGHAGRLLASRFAPEEFGEGYVSWEKLREFLEYELKEAVIWQGHWQGDLTQMPKIEGLEVIRRPGHNIRQN